jgi:hypothetical protein
MGPAEAEAAEAVACTPEVVQTVGAIAAERTEEVEHVDVNNNGLDGDSRRKGGEWATAAADDGDKGYTRLAGVREGVLEAQAACVVGLDRPVCESWP